MQDLFQIFELLAVFEASEFLFGCQQRCGGPAQDHARSIPAFDSAGAVGGLRKTVLDQISAGEDATEMRCQLQLLDRQSLFQAFQQTAGRPGSEALQPARVWRRSFSAALGSFLPQAARKRQAV